MDFDDVSRKQVEVKYKGTLHWLVEASAEAVVRFRNANLRAAKMNRRGTIVTMDGLADSEPQLVADCLYKADEAGQLPLKKDGEPDPRARVALAFVKALPNRVLAWCYQWIHDNSDMKDKDTVDSVRKRIKADKVKLATLEGRDEDEEDEEDPAKNSLDGAATTSS